MQGMAPNDFHYVILKKETIRNLYGENDKRIDAYFYGMNEEYDGVEDNAFIYKWRYPIHELSEWWPEPEYKGMDVNRIVWRLADIFLLRAECRVRLGKADAVEDLIKFVNVPVSLIIQQVKGIYVMQYLKNVLVS